MCITRVLWKPNCGSGFCCCSVLQHTWADAMVAVTMFTQVMDNMNTEMKASGFPKPHPAGYKSPQPAPRKLQWKWDDTVLESVELAYSNMTKLIEVGAL